MKKSIAFLLVFLGLSLALSTFIACNPEDSETVYEIPEDDGPETVYDSVD